MAISGTLSGAGTSATLTPANGVSDVVVDKRAGTILLEAKAPNTDWTIVSTGSGAYSVSTPDSAISYRFRGDANCDADYYMGP